MIALVLFVLLPVAGALLWVIRDLSVTRPRARAQRLAAFDARHIAKRPGQGVGQ